MLPTINVAHIDFSSSQSDEVCYEAANLEGDFFPGRALVNLRRRIPTDYGRAEIICYTPVPRLGTLGSSNDVDLNVALEKRPVLLHCELGPSRREHDGLILRVASTNTAKFLA
jgi:hypothetical protein